MSAADSSRWEPVIGLEIHVQLRTRTKLFCGCGNRSGDDPNSRVCRVCLGYPGALPMPNERAVELAARLALACGGTVREESVWSRKSYFYPDLPKGFQITQYDRPYCDGGELRAGDDGPRVRLRRMHLEEDAGRTLHENPFPDVPDTVSLLDFNRAGVPLVEVVTEPDLRSAADAAATFAGLREIVVATGVGDANLEEGNLRCDANVSLRPRGSETLGTRVEIKNLNSIRFLREAILHEIDRQAALLEAGGTVVQETRLYDPDRGTTRPMRGKEEADDYRYFDEPDLPPLRIPAERIDAIRADLPELPHVRRARLVALGLSAGEAATLTAEPERAARFDRLAAAVGDGEALRIAARLETGVVVELEREREGEPVAEALVAEAARLVAAGDVTFGAAKQLLGKAQPGDSLADLAGSLGLRANRDEGALAAAVAKVIEASPEQVAQYRSGKVAVIGFLVGRVMKESAGADPKLVRALLEKALGA